MSRLCYIGGTSTPNWANGQPIRTAIPTVNVSRNFCPRCFNGLRTIILLTVVADIYWMLFWARRQRLSVYQTHKAPAAAVGCFWGPQSVRRSAPRQPSKHISSPIGCRAAARPSPPAPSRRTRPMLTKTPHQIELPKAQ